jgi:hypothetical protein
MDLYVRNILTQKRVPVKRGKSQVPLIVFGSVSSLVLMSCYSYLHIPPDLEEARCR